MSFVREVKRRIKLAVPPAIFLALTAYFGWNATQGDRGLKEYAKRQQDLVAAQADLANAQADQDEWSRRIASLSTNHLDLDSLDERSRAMLNLADPNDIVVPYGQGNKLY